MNLTKQHIAVTGATGFIGQHLVHKLHLEKQQVWAIVRPNSSIPPAIAKIALPIIFDGNVITLTQQLKENHITGIIHLASLFLSQHTANDIVSLIDSNVLFGTQLLEAVSQTNVRWFINTGTFWQHYQNKEYSPTNLYAATKQAFTAIAQYYYETRPFDFITLELSDTFGPNDTRPKILSLWQKTLHSHQVLAMSAGKQKIDLNYIENVTDAFTYAVRLLAGDTNLQYKGNSYAITSGQTLTLRELAKLFEKVAGHKLAVAWGEKPYRPREVMEPWCKGQSLPGWHAPISLEVGLKRTIDSNFNASHHDESQNSNNS